MKKSLLYIAALLLISSACSSKQDASASTEQAKEKKEIALQLYSLRDDIQKDYAGTIKKAGEMGFTAVEAAGYGDGKFYGKTPQEFKADIENAGMKVLSSHTTKSLTEKELATKDFSESLKWWDTCIEAHKAAGMEYIVAPWMEVPKTIKDLQTYCEFYNEIGKRCKAQGMKFGYHNHDHEFKKVEDQVMYDYMIENTDPELVFFEMDVYWVVRGSQSPVDYFNKYPGRFKLLHIKDNKELGQSGMVGFDAIFKNTDAAGTEYLVVEVEKYNFTPAESVKLSLDYLLNCPLVKTSYRK
ncbi:sugar phosphate isomerase/epimerase family protein [Dysgonomonas sp. ZJ279]|uniref:sugar phosphate isomerase/epimerase family protein n=1 Tax=Dysgonomonas sp. ZJ279 TaxID=2709796 RepID=UPI0013EA8321|nr:sugar phosphate isomerase/epimerase [Dysgonomonas sp. ZJ279]